MPIYANPIGAMMQGYKSGQGVQDMRRENALRQLYEQQGAGIAAGDQNALNALAQLDPMAALDVRRVHNADRRADRADQRADAALNISQERLAMAKEASRREAERLVAEGKAEEVEREAAQVKNIMDNMSQALGRGDMETFTTIRNGLPEEYHGITPGNFPQVATLAGVSLEGMYEAMDSARAKPMSGPGRVQADINAGFLPEETPLRGNGTTVNVGPQNPMPGLSKLGEGHTYLYNPDGSIKLDERGRPMASTVPGSKAERDARAAALENAGDAAARGRKENEQRLKLGTTLSSVALNLEALDGGLPVTGALGQARQTWVGSLLTGAGAVDFQNRTNQITDSAALAEIQRMRDNSKTGGAVGALTDGERIAIGNAVTALNAAGGAEEYARAAKAYRELALNLAFGEGYWQLSEDGQSVILGEGSTATGAPEGVPPDLWEHMSPDERALWQN